MDNLLGRTPPWTVHHRNVAGEPRFRLYHGDLNLSEIRRVPESRPWGAFVWVKAEAPWADFPEAGRFTGWVARVGITMESEMAFSALTGSPHLLRFPVYFGVNI